MDWYSYTLCSSMARVQREREWGDEWLRLMAWEFVWRTFYSQLQGVVEDDDKGRDGRD